MPDLFRRSSRALLSAERAFSKRRVFIAPGATLPYFANEWRGALVILEQGFIELETASGVRAVVGPGDMFWLHDLAVRTLRNLATHSAVLIVIARLTPSFARAPATTS